MSNSQLTAVRSQSGASGGTLALWRAEEFQYADAPGPHRYQVYVAAADLRDEDIVVGEGRRIVFVDPADVPGLDKSDSCAHFVAGFLASPEYARLAGPPGSATRGGAGADGHG
jgi:hypothetical protein